MAKLVQDEAGNIFVDEGGGFLTQVTEDQARAFSENQGAGQNAARSANLAITNLGTGAMSLLSDDPKWRELNKLGREEAEALKLAQPMIGGAASLAPQAAVAPLAGTSMAGAAALEGLLGAATTPESPVAGALIGGGLGAAGAALPGALGWAGNKARQQAGRFGMGTTLDDALAPGIPRPGTAAAADEAFEPVEAAAPGAPPPSAAPGVSSPFTDLSGDMSTGVLQVRPGAAVADAVGDLPLTAQRPTRMVDRVVQGIEQEGQAQQRVGATRVAGDMMSPEELAQYGIELNPGQRSFLTATTADPNAARAAREMMATEELRRSWPVVGKKFDDNINAQREAATQYLGHQLDLPPGIALTDGTVSEAMAGIGLRMDQIAEQMGGVPITKEIRDDLAEVMRLSTGKHKSTLQRTIDEALAKADNNGGMLDGQGWQVIRTDLNKQIDKGVRDGRIEWINEASDVMDTLARAMENRLPTETQRELRRLRKQYAIGATLSKTGTRTKDGTVNPTSFYNNWKRPQSMKQRGKDDVGRFMNTIDFLTTPRKPNSGTTDRLVQFGANTAADLVPGGQTIKALIK